MYVPVSPKHFLAATLTLMVSTGAFAGVNHSSGDGQGGGQGVNIGGAGTPSDASRIVEIVMNDSGFALERISVKNGETIRFVVKNEGDFVHEFNIGTVVMHAAHQKEMVKMFERGVLEVDKIHRDKMKMSMGGGHGMAHDDPNSVLLEPGEAGEIVWTFVTHTKLEYACNLPGHYQSGMRGEFL